MTAAANHVEEATHFRVEFLLRQATLEPELEHYWLQVAAEWMVKGCHDLQVRARTYRSDTSTAYKIESKGICTVLRS